MFIAASRLYIHPQPNPHLIIYKIRVALWKREAGSLHFLFVRRLSRAGATMNDQHAGQPPETQSSLTRDNGNWSQPSSDAIGIPLRELKQPSTPKSAKVEPIDQASIHKSTGPRTPQGKQRSKYNALKHGIYSKAPLLKDESHARFQSLLHELQEYHQPEGST